MQTSSPKDLSLKEEIWQIVSAIPFGKVATYGQVAKLAGYPRHARYVGTTLSKLPAGTQLPWFRVLNGKGSLCFKYGSEAFLKQKSLLEKEGVFFQDQRISLKLYQWQP